MKTNPNNESPAKPRREVALGGLAVIASMLVAFNPFKSAATKKTTVKMLAEDGTLVEVDVSAIPNQGKRKISDKELQEWVKAK